MNILYQISKIIRTCYFRLYERTWQGRLRYMFIKNNNSKDLIVVFSGFPAGDKPVYNYIRTLKEVKADKLFILDDFGYRGSYYLKENGCDKPRELCKGLLERIIKNGGG